MSPSRRTLFSEHTVMAVSVQPEKPCAAGHRSGLVPMQLVGCTCSEEEYRDYMSTLDTSWYATLFDPDTADVQNLDVKLRCDACRDSGKTPSECTHNDDGEHLPWVTSVQEMRDVDEVTTTPWELYTSTCEPHAPFSASRRAKLRRVYNFRDTWNDILAAHDWGLFTHVLRDSLDPNNDRPYYNAAHVLLWEGTTTRSLVQCYQTSRAAVDRALRPPPIDDQSEDEWAGYGAQFMEDSEEEAACPVDLATVCSLDPRFYARNRSSTDPFVLQTDRIATIALLVSALAYASVTDDVALLRKLLRAASKITRCVASDLDVSRTGVEALICSRAFRHCTSEPCMRLLLQYRAPLLLDEQDALLKEAYRWHDECAPYLSPPDPVPTPDPVPVFEAPVDFLDDYVLPKAFQQSIRRFRATRVAHVAILKRITASILCPDVAPMIVDFLPGPPVLDWTGKRSPVDAFKAILHTMNTNIAVRDRALAAEQEKQNVLFEMLQQVASEQIQYGINDPL